MKFLVFKRKSMLLWSVLAVSLAVLTAIASVTGFGVIAVGKTTRKLPIYCVDTPEKCVALTFDASWGADKTPSILSTVSEYGIKATFFCVGFWAEKYPQMLKKLADSNHFEIGTHSNTHPHMAKLSQNQVKAELTTSLETIEKITGTRPSLFRAPYGEYSDTVINTASDLSLYTIQWDVDTLDWKDLSASQIASRVLKSAKNGSIILMHNDGKNTVQSLSLIIEGLKNKGYKFVSVGELIYKDNYKIDHTGKQIRIEG